MPELSVIIPVYNEAKTLKEIIEKVLFSKIDKEVIVVDDGSSDGSSEILRTLHYKNLKVVHHTTRRGKGAALLTGLSIAEGEFLVIQDADLEYSPQDYQKLVNPVKDNLADLVLGARFIYGYKGHFIHKLGNRCLTWLLNLLFSSRINDYSTCYKLARKETWLNLELKAKGFDIDVEIICNALKKKKRISEAPIFYTPRSYSEGKKIRWKDGLWAIFYIVKYRIII